MGYMHFSACALATFCYYPVFTCTVRVIGLFGPVEIQSQLVVDFLMGIPPRHGIITVLSVLDEVTMMALMSGRQKFYP